MSSDPNPDDERLEIFDHHAAHLLAAIRLCSKNGYIIPAMMLTFAGIDGMAWLYRQNERPSNRNDFQQWTRRFMLGGLPLEIVESEDLWAARNALLHSQSSYSNLTTHGTAKSFVYLDSGQIFFPAEIDGTSQTIILTASDVVDRFEIAINAFRDFIQSSESERQDSILNRCWQLFDYRPPSGRAV
jgi:hypothetical protein